VLKTLYSTIEALTRCRKLTITALGRSLNRNCYIKHKIKAVDRLFGNFTLQVNVIDFYKVISNTIIGSNKNPIIIIDWSGLTSCGNFHFIRAAIPLGGRALPILEMPFDLNQYTNPKSHTLFLKRLKAILPKDCKPILVTDAGFRNPWFKLVSSLGWDYIGRIRQNTYCRIVNTENWIHVKELYQLATRTAQYLGKYQLAKSNKLNTEMYLYKDKAKNRIKMTLAGKKIRCSASLKHQKRESEPLLIVTSLPAKCYNPNQIVKLYQKRMQIEEGFRDLKSEKSGFSLRQNRSMSVGRLSIALLIGAIGMLILWVIGIVAKEREIHYHYQANTTKHRNVLSLFIIGWQFIEEAKSTLTPQELKNSLKHLQQAQYA
jgi:hypothetical protein